MTRTFSACAAVTCIVLAGCAEAPQSTSSSVSEQSLQLFGDGTVSQVSRAALGGKTREAYKRFTETVDKPFAAFYLSSNGGWGWSAGHFTLDDAKRVSQTVCQTKTKGPCTLYATISPPAAKVIGGLPNRAEEVLSEARSENNGGFLVIAKNPIGSYSFSWNYVGSSVAQRDSIRVCDGAAKRTRAQEEADLVQAFDAAGLYKCEIFSV